MFDISFSEILLILVISLLIFGPEQLPAIATKLGRFVATIRNFSLNIKEQFYEQSGFNQFENIRSEMQQSFSQLKEQLRLQVNNNDFINEDTFLYQEFDFLYQPELDFDQQPELFDE